jgi:hypothetical protein
VSLRKVSFSLSEEEIIKRASGKMAYAITNYMILTNGDEWAVMRIEKARGPGLFKRIEKVEVVSLPEDTVYVEDPTVDVLNPSVMVGIAEKEGKETLIVKGKFEHVSFIHNEKSEPLKVFDVVPPNPPKLIELAERALGTGRICKPITIVPDILDLNELAQASVTTFTMFPCYTPGLSSGENALFLDQAPDISSIGVDNITLIGCDLSLRTFISHYGKEPKFIDMCPRKRSSSEEVVNKYLSRCCFIDEEYERRGDIACVSWGAKVSDVEEAILDLFDLY